MPRPVLTPAAPPGAVAAAPVAPDAAALDAPLAAEPNCRMPDWPPRPKFAASLVSCMPMVLAASRARVWAAASVAALVAAKSLEAARAAGLVGSMPRLANRRWACPCWPAAAVRTSPSAALACFSCSSGAE